MIQRKKIYTYSHAPKTFTSMQIDGCANLRQYADLSGQHTPDYSLVPLVLIPTIGYSTGNGTVENAATELYGGAWYVVTSGGKTAITHTAGVYEIDSTPGSTTYGRLTVKKNLDAGQSVTFLFEATVKIRGVETPVTCSEHAVCASVDNLPEMYFDNETESLYNPWEDNAYFYIHPFIVPTPASVTYQWQTCHVNIETGNEEWRTLEVSPFDWAIKADGNGIRIDRSLMQDNLRLKCIATVGIGTASIVVERTLTHNRLLPGFEFDITHLAGLHADATSISPYARIFSNRMEIEGANANQLQIDWYNGGNSVIATGQNPTIPISSVGIGNELGLDVTDKGGYKALTDSDGLVLTDTDGAVLIVQMP